MPWHAATRLSGSRRSPKASSTPSASNSRGEAGRTRARTRCPAARSRSTTAVPSWPVAPTTRIGCMALLLLDLDGEPGSQPQTKVDDAAGPLLPGDPGGHALPDPDGEVLRRRRRPRKVGHVAVQVAVVERTVHFLLEDAVEVGQVDDHGRLGVHLARHRDFEGVVVAVA